MAAKKGIEVIDMQYNFRIHLLLRESIKTYLTRTRLECGLAMELTETRLYAAHQMTEPSLTESCGMGIA